MLVSVAARGNSSSSSAPKQEGDVKEITVWAWGPTLTQVAKDFKKETGINVGNIEAGLFNPMLDTIDRLCRYYGTTLGEFFRELEM